MRELLDILEESGIHGILGYLNARTPHRFTGLYRFDQPLLRNVQLYDSENPKLRIGSDAPMRETYCSLVGAAEEPFMTGDARADPRVAGHPARESTLSYTGVLVRTGDEEPFGTLCHFDLVPRPVAADQLPLMEAAAAIIAEHLEQRPAGVSPTD